MKKLMILMLLASFSLGTIAQTRPDTVKKKTEWPKKKPDKKDPSKRDTMKRDTMKRDTTRKLPPR
ncbi:hypothetical protein ASE92_10360 [Pedobacter sp. Leaf41]|jgi:pentapeptide MXKDX repeat protein|uniref:hypothetical protein n=1 Tax=Pedobacter sp. Leaf41 TaxID=1736218 RepID=UPI000702F8F5|nr:hypothetical protein [Pedobacter sp. Leaf41]KQN35020.1 hypothetical protein ASE92_10360 [Pedobacter sp. Leaf41]RZL36598.1 MAG: hypothetical protein EOO96_06665 [Pedobacter sp.]